VAGSACDAPLVECEYDSDPRRECRTYSVCLGAPSGSPSATTWRVQRNRCDPPLTAVCPATFSGAADQPCSPKDAWCTYPDGGRCHCTDCRTGPTSVICTGMPVWRCEGTEQNAGCPKYMPRIGSPCTAPSVVNCNYGCEWGSATCLRGVWQRADSGCPMARDQSAKTSKVSITAPAMLLK
jgi:hypothetical protein